MADNSKAHHELLMQNMGLQVEEIIEGMNHMLDILALEGPSRVALPLIKTIQDIMRSLWQTPASLPSTTNNKERKYFVSCKDPGSLVVKAANERERQGLQGPMLKAKNAKKLNLFGRKLYSTGGSNCEPASYPKQVHI